MNYYLTISTLVPGIDKLAGIMCYCTKGHGIGGTIKSKPEDFKVEEIIDESNVDLSLIKTDYYKFPLFLLEKSNIDSNHAIFEIQKNYDLHLKILGIKDAKAITKQYAYSIQTRKNLPKRVITKNTILTLVGFLKKPLDKSCLLGNKFEIQIENIKSHNPIKILESFISEKNNIGNFYGLQRFGSERLVTHLVGRELVKKNFKKAIEYLLTYTSEYDSELSKEIREKLKDPLNYPILLKKFPRGMDIEYSLIKSLINGSQPVETIRSIPIQIRRLFIHAYQAYLFNKTLSTAILNEEDISRCKDNDICFEIKKPLYFGRIRKFSSSNDKENNKKIDNFMDVTPAIRLVGYAFQPGKGRFDKIIMDILEEEGVTPRDFYIKDLQELSEQGGFRQSSLFLNSFSYSVKNHTTNKKHILSAETDNENLGISFGLSKGSYATILLRELMKPKDPILAGF